MIMSCQISDKYMNTYNAIAYIIIIIGVFNGQRNENGEGTHQTPTLSLFIMRRLNFSNFPDRHVWKNHINFQQQQLSHGEHVYNQPILCGMNCDKNV